MQHGRNCINRVARSKPGWQSLVPVVAAVIAILVFASTVLTAALPVFAGFGRFVAAIVITATATTTGSQNGNQTKRNSGQRGLQTIDHVGSPDSSRARTTCASSKVMAWVHDHLRLTLRCFMLLPIADILTPDDLAAIAGRLAGLSFSDGRATAGAVARTVKSNEQATGPDAAALRDFLLAAVKRNPVLEAAARPAKFGPALISRYQPGMTYGRHVDNPFMDGVRADLSFTLFLSAPDTYDGGELALDLPGGSQSIKLPAGCLVLYPSTTIHEVLPVTRGERLAFVGWIESRVRGADQREALFDLARARAGVSGEAGLLLQKLEANLLRWWG